MRVKIELEVEMPDIEHTEVQLDEYLRYSFGDNASIRIDNPFNILGEPVAVFGTFMWDKI